MSTTPHCPGRPSRVCFIPEVSSGHMIKLAYEPLPGIRPPGSPLFIPVLTPNGLTRKKGMCAPTWKAISPCPRSNRAGIPRRRKPASYSAVWKNRGSGIEMPARARCSSFILQFPPPSTGNSHFPRQRLTPRRYNKRTLPDSGKSSGSRRNAMASSSPPSLSALHDHFQV